MRTIILTGAATLALMALPAIAQDADHDQDNTRQQDTADAHAPRSADQANERAQPAPPSTTVVTDAATGASAVVTTYPGNVSPPSPAALNKHYPLCTRRLQDNCQNPGEGGAPGRDRALPYWPGKPASETDR